jgi:hypothetical protein
MASLISGYEYDSWVTEFVETLHEVLAGTLKEHVFVT